MSFIPGWYVIYTKSRYEKTIAKKLHDQNFNVYLPLSKTISQWSDRKKEIEKPLFSSYVFVYLKTMKDYFRSLTIDGIVLFIKFGERLVRVLDEEIERIKIFLNQFSGIEIRSTEILRVGETRRINFGLLEDYECEIIKIDTKQKVCIRISSLNQSLTAEIPSHYLF